MSAEDYDRLDLSCLVENIPITIVTRFGTVYQGTVLDWGCGRSSSSDAVVSNKDGSPTPRSYDGHVSFIRLQLSCRPGEICCDETPVDTPAIVNGIRSSVDNTYPLYEIGNIVLINWDDISSIGPQRNCLTG